MFKSSYRIILASASPRREELLKNLGLAFDIIPPKGQEPERSPHEDIKSFAMRVAKQKANEVFSLQNWIGKTAVIGADTVVSINNTALGKPVDEDDALQMLLLLAGQQSEVYTGCCVITYDSEQKTEHLFYSKSKVFMSHFNESTLQAYVSTGEPMDKAGAYAMQGIGSFLIRHIEGSWSNIVGLPVNELLMLLLQESILELDQNLQK